MAKKSSKKEVNIKEEIEELREEMQSDQEVCEQPLTSFDEEYQKEFGCNLYLKSIIKRKVGVGDKDVITALKILRAIDRYRGTNDLTVWAEGTLKPIVDILKGVK